MRLFVTDLSFGNISSSSALSVMSKSSGHEIFISAAFFKTLATVFLDTPQLCAMFRSLNPKLCKRRISRYLVIIVTSFTCIHTNGVYQQYKGNICNRAFKCGSELPEYVALILRNGGSQSPDRWLRELRNNHMDSFRPQRDFFICFHNDTVSFLCYEKSVSEKYSC